ncbi:hypothetical protein [uncultured Sphingomonas sp.]|uniref:hypothetical protein n=1 Tax=uncultured Sphingomonas sp. TaxID=158754 RepID=UPI0025CBB605|nr:hypothetical protein [uncultured Sphingomonas sp.]
MTFALFLLSAAAVTMPVATQDHGGHTPAAPATAAPAAAAKFTLDTPVATLMADARAKAAVDAVLPGVDAHPAYEQFKAMSLNQLAPMAPNLLTADALAKVKIGLDAIK